MTSIERRNAMRSRRAAMIGTLIFHVILIGYMVYTSNPEGEGVLDSIKGLFGSGVPSSVV